MDCFASLAMTIVLIKRNLSKSVRPAASKVDLLRSSLNQRQTGTNKPTSKYQSPHIPHTPYIFVRPLPATPVRRCPKRGDCSPARGVAVLLRGKPGLARDLRQEDQVSLPDDPMNAPLLSARPLASAQLPSAAPSTVMPSAGMEKRLDLLGRLPVPLRRPFKAGLDAALAHAPRRLACRMLSGAEWYTPFDQQA
jgi:hypothetical protein